MSNEIFYYRTDTDFHPIRKENDWDIPDSTEKLMKVFFILFRN